MFVVFTKQIDDVINHIDDVSRDVIAELLEVPISINYGLYRGRARLVKRALLVKCMVIIKKQYLGSDVYEYHKSLFISFFQFLNFFDIFHWIALQKFLK